MRQTAKLLIIAYGVLMLVFIFSYSGDTGANHAPVVIDIGTFPTSKLFELANLKPGDIAQQTVTIQNKGNKDFHYTMSAEKNSGIDVDILYNQLLLEVADEQRVLYQGKLSEFNGLAQSRFLASSRDEKLNVKVEFPWESGNEFQGLATAVLLTFVAEGKTDPGGGGDGGGGDGGGGGSGGNGDKPSDKPRNNDRPPHNPPVDGGSPSKNESFVEEGIGSEELEKVQTGLALDTPVEHNLAADPLAYPDRLPQTGAINPAYFYGVGLVIMLLGALLLRKKRRINKDQ